MEMTAEEFVACWKGLDDPRGGSATLNDFRELSIVALCTVLRGGHSAVDLALFAEAKEPFLRDLHKLDEALPSHDTLSRPSRQPAWRTRPFFVSGERIDPAVRRNSDRRRLSLDGAAIVAGLLMHATRGLVKDWHIYGNVGTIVFDLGPLYALTTAVQGVARG